MRIFADGLRAEPNRSQECPLELIYRALPQDQRYTMRSNLSVLSLLEARADMPDPVPHRATLADLMARLERTGSP